MQPRTADQALAESVPTAKSARRRGSGKPGAAPSGKPLNRRHVRVQARRGKSSAHRRFRVGTRHRPPSAPRHYPGIGPSTAESLPPAGLSRVIDALYFPPSAGMTCASWCRSGRCSPAYCRSTVVVVERSRVVWRAALLRAMLRGEDGETSWRAGFISSAGMQRRLQQGRALLTVTPVRFRNALQVVHPSWPTWRRGADGRGFGSRRTKNCRAQPRARTAQSRRRPAAPVERLCQSLCERYADQVPDAFTGAFAQAEPAALPDGPCAPFICRRPSCRRRSWSGSTRVWPRPSGG